MFAKTRNAITVHFKDTRNDDWLIVGKTHFDKGSFLLLSHIANCSTPSNELPTDNLFLPKSLLQFQRS